MALKDDESAGEYQLVMPFVLVQSEGGPYDDASYVSGWNMGRLDGELALLKDFGALPRPRYLNTQDKPQIDLLAMKHGFVVRAEEWEEDPRLSRYDFDHTSEEPPL